MKESFERLVELSKKLRKECAWDRKETLESYSKYILDEAQEIKEAVEKKDPEELKGELGDQLWNVLFMTNIANDLGWFELKDVMETIHAKMIRRHPHIFNGEDAKNTSEIETRYEEIKKIERETPSTKECLKLLDEVDFPDNIRRHSLLVNKISLFLAKKLLHKGKYVNLSLVNAASLLHDIDKKICLDDKSKIHGKEAYNMLVEKGHNAVAEIVLRHCIEYVKEHSLDNWESKIVHYADKRVNNFKLVSLKDRLEYIHNTYPDVVKECYFMDDFIYDLENEIFNELDFGPDELGEEMKKDGISTIQ